MLRAAADGRIAGFEQLRRVGRDRPARGERRPAAQGRAGIWALRSRDAGARRLARTASLKPSRFPRELGRWRIARRCLGCSRFCARGGLTAARPRRFTSVERGACSAGGGTEHRQLDCLGRARAYKVPLAAAIVIIAVVSSDAVPRWPGDRRTSGARIGEESALLSGAVLVAVGAAIAAGVL